MILQKPEQMGCIILKKKIPAIVPFSPFLESSFTLTGDDPAVCCRHIGLVTRLLLVISNITESVFINKEINVRIRAGILVSPVWQPCTHAPDPFTRHGRSS